MAARTLLTTGDVARHCQVTQRTVHNWIRTGHLPTSRTPGGHQRIQVLDFQRFLQEHRMPAYAPEPAPSPTPPSGRRRVLVVDDEAQVRDIVVRALRRHDGYEVATAADGFSAGLEVGRFRPHVVVMDVLMPYMDGLEACRWIKQDRRTADTRVLIVSALNETGMHDRAVQAGVDGWMQKPIRLAELVDRVAALAAAPEPAA